MKGFEWVEQLGGKPVVSAVHEIDGDTWRVLEGEGISSGLELTGRDGDLPDLLLSEGSPSPAPRVNWMASFALPGLDNERFAFEGSAATFDQARHEALAVRIEFEEAHGLRWFADELGVMAALDGVTIRLEEISLARPRPGFPRWSWTVQSKAARQAKDLRTRMENSARGGAATRDEAMTAANAAAARMVAGSRSSSL